MQLTAVAAVLLALAGQQPSSPDQPIKSSVDLVRVDVTAVDAQGRPIPDLSRDDFELRVDGRRRAITTAQFVEVPADTTGRPRDPSHYSSNADDAGGRLIMLVVDRTSITAGRAKPTLLAASGFVGSLNRADRVALATIPDGPQVTFTADHELVQRLILDIAGTALDSFGNRNIGVSDALAFERRDDSQMQMIVERECGAPATGGGDQRGGSSELMICQGEVKAEALLVAADARARARQSIVGLQALLGSFPPSQSPKMLVFLSQGLVIDGEASSLSWLDARAAAAHVTIYPLHLESFVMDASQRKPPVRPMADRTVQEHGLAALAQSTGGQLFRVISNSDFAFERLAAELSGYYLLGFEPEARERDGMPHEIKVQVGRRGATVRSRRQFTIPLSSVVTTDSELVAALRDPLPAVDIPLKLTTYSVRDPRKGQMRLLLAAEIDRSSDAGGELAVGYVVVDFDGRLVTSRMDAGLPAPAPDQPRIQSYFGEVPVGEGKYTVKLAAVDGTGRRGSVERVAVVEMSRAGPVRATELLIGHRPDKGWALPVAPTVTAEITSGALHAFTELVADPGILEQVSVTLEIAASDTSEALERVPLQLLTPEDDLRCRLASARINLARIQPGDYVARAVIAVGLDTVGQITRPFRIAPR